MRSSEGFDYNVLSGEERSKLEALAQSILACEKQITRDGFAIGEALLTARESVSDGTFQRWCIEAVGFQPRRAELYMGAARLARSRGKEILEMPLSAAQLLGAPSVAARTVDEAIALIRRGEPVTVEWVKQTIRRDRGNVPRVDETSSQSRETAAMIAEALDLAQCRQVHTFLGARPSVRNFVADLAAEISGQLDNRKRANDGLAAAGLPAN